MLPALARAASGAGNGQRDPTCNQHYADDGRNALAVTSLHADARAHDLNALRLAVRNRHDQRCDAKNGQEQACDQKYLRSCSSAS